MMDHTNSTWKTSYLWEFRSGSQNSWHSTYSHMLFYSTGSTVASDLQQGSSRSDRYKQRRKSFQRYSKRLPMDYDASRAPFHEFQGRFLGTQPRSFEELHIERSYLLNCLQRADNRATDLLKNIRDLEESLYNGLPDRLRIARRKLGGMKKRMHECTVQEKAILARLGQVAYEIQYNERLRRIENDRLYHLAWYEAQQANSNAEYFPCSSEAVSTSQWLAQQPYYASQYGGSTMQRPIPELAVESPAASICCENKIFPPVASSPITCRPRAASLLGVASHIEKEKRLSMPDLGSEDTE
jgi:hypothetical protein